MGILDKVRYARHIVQDTPGAPSLLGFAMRSAMWRLRSATARGATVPFGSPGVRLWCPPEWQGNAKLNYIMREALEPDLAVATALLGPGSLAIDVGAHYGAFTVLMAHAVGGEGQVIACEPSPHAMQVLAKNVSLNDLRTVECTQAAIADRETEAEFFEHQDPSRSSLTRDEESTAEVRVHVTTLDSILADRDRSVALIKIDVEGYEEAVLRGALQVLDADRPIVLFEHLPGVTSASGWDIGAPLRILRDHGYEIREFHRGTWLDVPAVAHHAKSLWPFPSAAW